MPEHPHSAAMARVAAASSAPDPPVAAEGAPVTASPQMPTWRWDIFCRVIDNHGDLGVCWRLSVDLAVRGHQVRLWVDDASALAWMAPHGHARVQVLPWSDTPLAGLDGPGEVAIEAFGCELPWSYQAAMAQTAQTVRTAPTAGTDPTSLRSPTAPVLTHHRPAQLAPRPTVWINLEYLSAEAHVERLHGLPSPVLSGPAQGLTKWFFYPGFTARTGGLIREPQRCSPPDQAPHADRPKGAAAPRSDLTSPATPPAGPRHRAWRVSLFCYEPRGLGGWLQGLGQGPLPVHLWVAAGRPQAAVRQCLAAGHRHGERLNLRFLPFLTQHRFDDLLHHCDLNVVRGEDSLVRAIWAARPLIWHIYPQADGAHHDKLEAFLALTQAPASLADYHRRWNADQTLPLPPLTQDCLVSWQDWVQALRDRLLAQPDLTSQLIAFVAGKR